MMHPTENIRHFLRPGVRVHMAGIGGVSMCALAEVLKGMGLNVQGSDMTDSDTVKHLRHRPQRRQPAKLRFGDPHRRHP